MTLDLRRTRLACLPTPLHFMPRLSDYLAGPRIYIKRDDLTGLAGGGNKARKLELLVAEALSQGCDSLITIGAPQSNHCRQTAAAAAASGLRSILVLRGFPPDEETGNLLLDRLVGAAIVWSRERAREEVMDETVEAERKAGRKPYPIPLGGSNALGAAAYALAMEELIAQADREFDRILFASSSGGTQAGLVVGSMIGGYEGEILGISIDEDLAALQSLVAGIASGSARLLGRRHDFDPDGIRACAGYLGEGYGIMGAAEREAIGMFATLEGILLDPVYTGRAAAGMIDLIRKGVIGRDETILFWHTGGTPALWAYSRQLLAGGRPEDSGR